MPRARAAPYSPAAQALALPPGFPSAFAFACAFACSCASASPGSAQQPAPTEAADTLPTLDLPALVVTALPFGLGSVEAPLAVSTVHPDAAGTVATGAGLGEVLRGMPGLQVDDRHTDALGDRVVLRGFGARSAFGVRGVRFMVDGIPATLADGQTDLSRVDLALVDRAQVLRGPASSLYGNAAGGVVLLRTEPPPMSELEARAELLATSTGARQAHARTGGRAGAASYRAAVTHRWGDGFRAFSESERTHVTLDALGAVAGGAVRATLGWVDYDAQNPGGITLAQLQDDRTGASPGNLAQRTGERASQTTLGATGDWSTGLGEIAAAAYALQREVDNPIPPAIIDLGRRAGGARVELRNKLGRARVALGVSADVQRDDRRNFENDGGERGALTLDQFEAVTSGALFAHALLPIGSRVSVMAGARYDRIRFEADDRFTAGDPDDSGTRDMGAFSPSAGVLLRATPEIDFYANVATAFETPTTTELANRPDGAGGFNPELQPQRALSYEIGGRGNVGAVRAELAAYHVDVDDALVPFEVPGAPGRQFFRNAGSVDHRGIEAAAAATWPANARWRVAYAYTDVRFDHFASDGEAFDGNRVPGIAPHRLQADLSVDAGPATLSLSALQAAGMWADDANAVRTDGYTLLSLSAEADLTIGDAELRPFVGVDNVLDEEYVGSVTVNAFGGRFYEPGPGRAFIIGLRAASSAIPSE